MNDQRSHWWPAYVGVGSNLDDPANQLKRAIAAMAEMPRTKLVLQSGFFSSAPLGPQDQPDYVNATVALLTRQNPNDLLASLQSIEQTQGRTRSDERWGPRTLDLDLLVYGSEVIEKPALTVPHPRIAERNFVLLPLNEIAPYLRIPGGALVATLAAAVSKREPRIERIVEN